MTLFNEMGDFREIQEEINSWTLKPVDKDKASSMELVELATRSSSSSGRIITGP